MNLKTVCLHAIDLPEVEGLPDIRIVAKTRNRQQLRQALTAQEIQVLLIDLDHENALDAVVETAEIAPQVGIVGVGGQSDPSRIIAAVRAGVKQLAAKPIDANDLVVAIRRVLNESTLSRGRGRVIATIGAVGGAGSTTVSCYLAKGLALASRSRALLVDLDFDFGTVARSWDLAPEHTIADIAGAGAIDAHMIEKAAMKLDEEVQVIGRPHTIEEGHTIDDIAIGGLVAAARNTYPYVVLDLPRKLDAVTGCAIEACDKLLVVLQLTVPAVDNAIRLVDALERLGYDHDRIEFVVNRYRKNVHTVSTELVEKQLKKPLLGIVPNDYQSIAHAIDGGQPVAPRNPVRTAIHELAAKLVGTGEIKAPTGWFERLFSMRRKQNKTEAPVAV